MSKVLIDRELLSVASLHLEYSGYTETGKKLRALLDAPSGTPAMPVKAYYHEAPNEYGGLNKSVGLEVRKQFTDAPLVLESDAKVRIERLEGEIAKRDEELAACRVAVENCDLFRARIAEMQERFDSSAHRTSLIGRLEIENAQLSAELSALKAQGVVMPEREEFEDAYSAEYGTPVSVLKLLREGENYIEKPQHSDRLNSSWWMWQKASARLNAAHVQQVSVPEGWRLVPVDPTPGMIDAALRSEDASLDPRSIVIADYRAMLAAAPAAPAADTGLVEALKLADWSGVNIGNKALISAAIEALAAHSAKGVV